MADPRDPTDNPWHAVPVNAETGKPLTELQGKRLDAIREAGDGLYKVMHIAEGSMMPAEHETEHHWGSRRMAHAATLLETSLMFARKAALE
jgi:hypothetical protein